MESNKFGSAIYSKWSVIGFCCFFSPIFGGFMLRQNLKEQGKVKLGNWVLVIAFLMTLFTGLIMTTPLAGAGVNFISNLVQGAMLTEYIFKRHFSGDFEYANKGIGKPLAISFLIVFGLMMLLISTGTPLPH